MIEVAADKVGIRMGLEKIDHDPDGIRLIGVIRSNPTEDFPLGHLQTFIPGVAHTPIRFGDKPDPVRMLGLARLRGWIRLLGSICLGNLFGDHLFKYI
jgi:hypothetical protein